MIKNKEEALRLINTMLGERFVLMLRIESRSTRKTLPVKQGLCTFLYENTKLSSADISWVLGYKFHEMAKYSRNQFYSRLELGWEEYADAWVMINKKYSKAEKKLELDYNAV